MWLYKLKKFIYERLIGLKNIIKEMARMKNLVILVILILTAISCSYVESGERQLRERGWECRYNYKGEVQVCGYIN